ncbi:hypothetical protein [Craterilacuibacter sinensis]|uniref:hypothetical protein n=1 Tax=Craterilacuibacter sinensis TaxID=2686017 RepID=UPI00136B2B5E|nr:hypothetical protein [Craterilacuibacter sinensis]
MSRDFARQQMQLAAWRIKRCPEREKAQNRDRALHAIKSFLEGVTRDRVGQRERQG